MDQDLPKRSMRQSILRGWLRKCPNCGEGQLFQGYLKASEHCPSCQEDFQYQRADDGPAWATMLITGHMLPPVVLGIYESYDNPNPIVVAIILVLFFTLITLLMLPRIKGVFIAIQWANYMYGFDPRRRDQSLSPKAAKT